MKIAAFLLGLTVVVAVVYGQSASPATTSALYEYASFSSMGDNSSIVWPDGSVLKLAGQFKRPSTANEKMFYMTMALNLLAQKQYSLFSSDTTPQFMNVGHENDLVFRRLATK